MKCLYAKPAMTTYHREEIMEMMGPVKTQYPVEPQPTPQPPPPPPPCVSCANVTASPSAFLQGKTFDASDPFQVSVDTGGCTAFQQVEVSIPGTSPMIFFQFDRADGSESGDIWSIDLVGFQILDDRDEYPLVVTLLDGRGGSASCETTIVVE